ncbi:uroporphyrinogen decarboxylase [Kineococcus rubinsiae]|uniref:uroporphyrinogen decarboxylase n=1 Tax=Kineococcus rubinsiae TaxID=2609562 RepID=UPI0014302406|nr:uroporphyrinogen decarboxylase [Kineococcus rubinsiae]NIZ89770.1 uroporphyrinogen decarboxylase [Kineococcus rubinsiae]
MPSTPPSTPPTAPATTSVPASAPYLQATRGEVSDHVPVWFMRQAGRSLPEYRAAREGTAMLDSCRTPELVTEITLQPVRRYGVDAAIFYSDIVVPLKAAGVDLDIVPGTGPVVAEPFRTRADLDRLPELAPEQVGFVTEAVGLITAELGATPLIGFAGAPFTLASYLVEGGPSRDLLRTKALMHADPGLWHDLLDRLAQITGEFLRTQVAAGASAVQLFDSWVGALSVADYRTSVAPHSARALAAVRDLGVPRTHFGTGTGELLGDLAAVDGGVDVLGVDFRVPLDEGARRGREGLAAAGLDRGVAVQGNLDPALLFAPWDVLRPAVHRVLEAGEAAGGGHVFNLGHGVPPTTDPDVLQRVVDEVHAWRAGA